MYLPDSLYDFAIKGLSNYVLRLFFCFPGGGGAWDPNHGVNITASSEKKRTVAEAVIIEELEPEVHPPEFPELDEAGGCLQSTRHAEVLGSCWKEPFSGEVLPPPSPGYFASMHLCCSRALKEEARGYIRLRIM